VASAWASPSQPPAADIKMQLTFHYIATLRFYWGGDMRSVCGWHSGCWLQQQRQHICSTDLLECVSAFPLTKPGCQFCNTTTAASDNLRHQAKAELEPKLESLFCLRILVAIRAKLCCWLGCGPQHFGLIYRKLCTEWSTASSTHMWNFSFSLAIFIPLFPFANSGT